MVYRRFMSSLLQYCSTKTDLHTSLRLFVYSCVQKPKSTINVFQKTLSQLKLYRCNYKQYRGQWWSQRGSLTHHSNFNWNRFTAGRFNIKNRLLFASAVGSFSWEENGIQDEEINKLVDEVGILKLGERIDSPHLPPIEDTKLPQDWQNVLDEPMIKMWKVEDKESGAILYKILGRNVDVTARDFFLVQTNIEYRKKWDKLVIEIDIVDENPSKSQQVLRWITTYPYPLYPREYVYVRRPKIISEKKLFAICSRAVEHPKCKYRRNIVRVPVYVSHMIIKPHRSEKEPGMDFLLTYSDEPQTLLSNRLTSWITTTAIPDFLKKVYSASVDVPAKYRNTIPELDPGDEDDDDSEVTTILTSIVPSIDNNTGDKDRLEDGEAIIKPIPTTVPLMDEEEEDKVQLDADGELVEAKNTPMATTVPSIDNRTGDESPPPCR